MATKGLVIAWMPVCQRCQTLATELDFDLLLLGRRGFRRPLTAPLTYPRLFFATIRELVRRRPPSVIVVAPPILTPLIVMMMGRLIGARVAIDGHSAAILDRRWRWSTPLLRLMVSRADAGLVTVNSLVPQLGRHARHPIVLPDPLPDLLRNAEGGAVDRPQPISGPHPEPSRTPGPAVVVAASGWGSDEPLEELAVAAADQPWRLMITGKPRRTLTLPPNAVVTGFLDGPSYVQALANADVVVVLTTRDQTLLSGAWEAVALGKALGLSGTASLREAFGTAAVYVADDSESIARGIQQALSRREELESQVAILAVALRAQSSARLLELAAAISRPAPRSDRKAP